MNFLHSRLFSWGGAGGGGWGRGYIYIDITEIIFQLNHQTAHYIFPTYISMNYGIKSIFTTQKTAKLKRKHSSRISIYNTNFLFFSVSARGSGQKSSRMLNTFFRPERLSQSPFPILLTSRVRRSLSLGSRMFLVLPALTQSVSSLSYYFTKTT